MGTVSFTSIRISSANFRLCHHTKKGFECIGYTLRIVYKTMPELRGLLEASDDLLFHLSDLLFQLLHPYI